MPLLMMIMMQIMMVLIMMMSLPRLSLPLRLSLPSISATTRSSTTLYRVLAYFFFTALIDDITSLQDWSYNSVLLAFVFTDC